MNEKCPVCGYTFGREAGYFTGAMYFSYTLGLVFIFAIFGVLWLLFSTDTFGQVAVLVVVASGLYLLTVPLVYRYSRVLWMHLDWRLGGVSEEDLR